VSGLATGRFESTSSRRIGTRRSASPRLFSAFYEDAAKRKLAFLLEDTNIFSVHDVRV
jgi:hypothetical protein